jgi:RND family efflux transporter MFP subunit
MSNRKVDPGNLVVGGSSNATLLSTIVSVDPIHFVFTASEADYLRYVRLDQSGARQSSRTLETPIAVRLMDEPEFQHPGVMNFVDNVLDPNSGTISGRAVLQNTSGILIPGAFGRLRLPGSGEYQALLLPDEAILSDQARKIVMVVDGEGKVSPRPVVLGDLHRGLRVIKQGLSPDDQVVVNGVQRARPGATVTPQVVELTLADE